MNLAPLADAAITLASAVVTVCIPVVVAFVAKKVGFDKDVALRDSLTTALQRGVGVALSAAQVAGDHRMQDVNIRNAALATVVQYAAQNAPDAVAHFGLSNADIAQKAAAELALKLHVMVPVDAPAVDADKPAAPVPAPAPKSALATPVPVLTVPAAPKP